MALPIIVKWGGQEYSVTTLSEDDTVLDLKQFLKTLTGVLPERQKLLGLKVKGKPAENDVKLGALKLKPNTKIMMMGTREESLEDVLGPPPDNDDVVNDFDIEDEVVEVENREENLLKISRRVKEYKVEILNPPREGKKLLVLDVDYTLFDHRSCAETGVELMRPYLHEFLTSAYEDYDIVIWSATNMKWIEAKMKELGVSTNANYKITFMLDSAAMITVHTPRRGLIDVMIPGFRSSGPTSGSPLKVRSLLGILSLPLSLPFPCLHILSFSLKINKLKKNHLLFKDLFSSVTFFFFF
ncbi:ubiquitin-like domain-containing CTD phosphatase 1 isoform X2 [Acinonyx jubatus]|uniref:Ubiquitin-like domain-containing CTD phosphatase 1 n=1 Tax=Acinonyx jubatus TaxID=32536 RepID=A0ABM3N838_ACIJB|nr:ubiquitin-like domain-containing CTD phosphatase 1 isoform X2 [Acinonyx jubatus]